MDETRRIGELNRSCYSENVLKYFFDKPDADSEDECSNSDDESDLGSQVSRIRREKHAIQPDNTLTRHTWYLSRRKIKSSGI